MEIASSAEMPLREIEQLIFPPLEVEACVLPSGVVLHLDIGKRTLGSIPNQHRVTE